MSDDSSMPSRSGPPDTISVRLATADDLDPLQRIETAAFASDRIARRRMRALIGAPSCDIKVAEYRGSIAGYCLVLHRRGSRVARLYSLAVDPRQAGQGIGQRLLAEAEADARRRGACALRLEVRETNAAGIRLYETNGYRLIGRREDYYRDGAAALRFERDLADAARPRKARPYPDHPAHLPA